MSEERARPKSKTQRPIFSLNTSDRNIPKFRIRPMTPGKNSHNNQVFQNPSLQYDKNLKCNKSVGRDQNPVKKETKDDIKRLNQIQNQMLMGQIKNNSDRSI